MQLDWQQPLQAHVRMLWSISTPLSFAQQLRWRVFLKVALPSLADVLGFVRHA